MSISVCLYEPLHLSNLNLSYIEDYLTKKFNNKIKIEIKNNITRDKGHLVEKFARIRVTDMNKEFIENEPLPIEIEFEKKTLKNKTIPNGFLLLYDGFELQNLFRELINKEELVLNNMHIIFTNRLIGTFDGDDKRYHARTNILGIPSIISLSGIVEAPAKPREFYLLKQRNIPIEILKEKFKGSFVDYDDKRLTDVIKGYVMQSIFYQLFGEGFCEDKNCKLFNAHWQEELINAQSNKLEFCRKHSEMLKSI